MLFGGDYLSADVGWIEVDEMKLSKDQRDTLISLAEGPVILALRSPIGASLLRKGLATRESLDQRDARGRRQCKLTLTEAGRAVLGVSR